MLIPQIIIIQPQGTQLTASSRRATELVALRWEKITLMTVW